MSRAQFLPLSRTNSPSSSATTTSYAGGRGPLAGERLVRAVLACNTRRIGGMLLTHCHGDYVGSMERILDCLPVERALQDFGFTKRPKAAFYEVLSLLAERVGLPRPRPRFGHGVTFASGAGLPALGGSYHPSRQNTQTGKLTPRMFDAIFRRVEQLCYRGGRRR